MTERAAEAAEIFLHPGELRVVRGPVWMKTVLGSCVGITFRIARIGVAGMGHPMLPSGARAGPPGSHGVAGRRYVDCSLREIAAKADRLGASRGEVELKLFGGADVLAFEGTRATIGALNSAMALRVAEELGFRLAARRLGGQSGIMIRFDTSTGEVFVRRLGALAGAQNRSPQRSVRDAK